MFSKESWFIYLVVTPAMAGGLTVVGFGPATVQVATVVLCSALAVAIMRWGEA